MLQRAISPTPAQMERLAAARETFLERIVDVLTERRAIFDKLQAVQVSTNLRAMQAATASWLQARAGRVCAAALAPGQLATMLFSCCLHASLSSLQCSCCALRCAAMLSHAPVEGRPWHAKVPCP